MQTRRFPSRIDQPAPTPLRVVVVGYGYWGPNLVRNVMESADFDLVALCERDPARGQAFSVKAPGVPVIRDFDLVLDDPTVDAVIVATPPHSHHGIVKAALMAGKHVLVEKPLATTSHDAFDLVDTAITRDVLLMPGHTFLYSPPVMKVRQLIDRDVLGEMYFVTSSRMNLGKYQKDGVICDLAPHDISILLHWIDEPIVQVAASGRSVFQPGVTETAFVTLTFAGGAAANIELSWLAPRKVRQMVVVGSQRMVQYDDTSSDEPIRIFDRGMEFETPENFGEYQLTYRSGDIVTPRLEPAEPLALELQDFAHCIRTGATPRSHAYLGLEVVTAMEAAEASLRRGGEPVSVAQLAERAVA
ncbi:MAG TPA: Gfo/Idh/MocA family oxidoreductase [Baekduia sp.]|jgi:predicted dehydrogenase